jgi:hypothetical protein
MNTNISKIVDEWSYRLSLIEGHDGLPDIESYSDLTVLKSILNEKHWPIEITYELLYNMEHPESKLITEAPFSYTELRTKKKYQPQWLDYINNGKEFELEPSGTAIIKKSFLNSKGDNSKKTFEDLLNAQGTAQDWVDFFKSNTNKIIPTNKGNHSLEQISKSTFTGQKGAAGGAAKPRDAAFYEMGICMAHAINNHGLGRDAAYNATDIDESKYIKYKEEVEDNVGNKIANDSKVKGLPILKHTGKGGLEGVAGKKYVNDTPKTDIMGKDRYSIKKEGGSQLMSGYKSDTLGVFYGAKEFWQNDPGGKPTQALDDVIDAIEDSITGFTDKAIKGDSEVGQIKDAFRSFYISKRRPDVRKEAETILKKEVKKKKPDKNIIKQLTGYTTPGKSLTDVAVDKHIKAEAGALGLISRADNLDWFIPGVTKIKPATTSKYFKDFLKTYEDTTMRDEAQAILEKAVDHKNLDSEFDKIWSSSHFKKWAVYEAASGNYKFSGDSKINSSQKAIANKIFKFGENGSVKIEDINPAWAAKFSKGVKSTVGYKSSGRSKASSWRLLVSEGLIPEGVSYDGTLVQYQMDRIVEEEYGKLSNDIQLLVEDYMEDIDMLLTEGLWTNLKKAGSKVASYLKKLAAKLYAKIKDMISAFYKKVFKKLIDNLKAFAKKGLDFFADALGIEINGDMDFNSLNVSV